MKRILEKLFKWKGRNLPLKDNKKWVACETSTTQETENKMRFVGGGALDAPQNVEMGNKVETFRLGHQVSKGGGPAPGYPSDWCSDIKAKISTIKLLP